MTTAVEMPVLVVNYILRIANFNPQSDLFSIHSFLSNDVLLNELCVLLFQSFHVRKSEMSRRETE